MRTTTRHLVAGPEAGAPIAGLGFGAGRARRLASSVRAGVWREMMLSRAHAMALAGFERERSK